MRKSTCLFVFVLAISGSLASCAGSTSDEGASVEDTLEIGETTQAIGTRWAGQDYMDECIAAGVPEPPPWNSSEWEPQGELDTKFVFPGLQALVYSYKKKDDDGNTTGVCIALPRLSPPTGIFDDERPITFLGIICQGNETSRACFWDGKRDAIKIGETTEYPIVSDKFVGGVDITAEACTNCHAGENAFLIHPGTPLASVGETNAKGWVHPIVPPAWPQNRQPGRLIDAIPHGPTELGSCLECHNKAGHNRFPRLDPLGAYCDTIVNQAYAPDGTMPPENEALGVSPGDPRYFVHGFFMNLGCALDIPPATEFSALEVQPSFSFLSAVPKVGDFNNDGRTDIATFALGMFPLVNVALSSGTGYPIATTWSMNFGTTGVPISVADVNGDGMDDVISHENAGSRVALSTGTSFGAGTLMGAPVKYQDGEIPAMGDVDNDGHADVIVFDKDGGIHVHVARYDGGSFAPFELWRANFFPRGRKLVGDINGDSLIDIANAPTNGSGDIFVSLSTGTSFTPAVRWLSGVGTDDAEMRLADVNGDAFADLVVIEHGSGRPVRVALSDGTRFAAPAEWHPGIGLASYQVAEFGSIESDYDADLIVFRQGLFGLVEVAFAEN